MKPRGEALRFGSNILPRLWCRECEEETLHQRNRCVHCGTERKVVVSGPDPYYVKSGRRGARASMGKGGRRRRA